MPQLFQQAVKSPVQPADNQQLWFISTQKMAYSGWPLKHQLGVSRLRNVVFAQKLWSILLQVRFLKPLPGFSRLRLRGLKIFVLKNEWVVHDRVNTRLPDDRWRSQSHRRTRLNRKLVTFRQRTQRTFCQKKVASSSWTSWRRYSWRIERSEFGLWMLDACCSY